MRSTEEVANGYNQGSIVFFHKEDNNIRVILDETRLSPVASCIVKVGVKYKHYVFIDRVDKRVNTQLTVHNLKTKKTVKRFVKTDKLSLPIL